MNVLIAADKFKGSLSAPEVCDAIAEGIHAADAYVQVTKVPLADGGEGTSGILTCLSNGYFIPLRVRDPLGRAIHATIGISEDGVDAFLEMASASGLLLLSTEERDPVHTSTVGTGDMILAAMNAGAKRVVLGIGGSATNDVGIGMAHALGYRFLDRDGVEVDPCGGNLHHIHVIDRAGVDQRIFSTQFIVLCDVTNPLHGPQGASQIFAPQKGAGRKEVDLLEHGVIAFAELVNREFSMDLNFPGSGAAGGLGAGAQLFLHATLVSGIDFIMEFSGLDHLVRQTDLVITGEGKVDHQSVSGKVLDGLSRLCRNHDKALWLVTGVNELEAQKLQNLGVSNTISLVESGASAEYAMANAFPLVKSLMTDAFRQSFSARPG